MNCQKGDRAIIIKGQLMGTVIICKKLVPGKRTGCPCWIPEEKIQGFRAIADRALKPLRDKPGEDETLSWKSVPVGETA